MTILPEGRDGDNEYARQARPLRIHDHPEMPAWVEAVLTEAQANAYGEIWRWKRLVYGSDLPGIAKAVAICIGDHCHATQLEAWPSINTIASEIGFSRGAVMTHIKDHLEPRGFIDAARDKNERTKRQRVSHYWPAWPERQTCRVQHVNPACQDVNPDMSPGGPGPGTPGVPEGSISEGSKEVSRRVAHAKRDASDSLITPERQVQEHAHASFLRKEGWTEERIARELKSFRDQHSREMAAA